MFSTIRADGGRRGSSRIRSAALFAVAAFLASGLDARAQQNDSILKQAFKVLGFATDVAPPVDFVGKTRPPGDLDYVPVFQPPPEPSRAPMKSTDLKAVQSDLDGVEKQHNVLRQGFPPAVKALAEQQAAKKKPSSSATGPQQ
jgi:hypothetical protein